jgi:protease-4
MISNHPKEKQLRLFITKSIILLLMLWSTANTTCAQSEKVECCYGILKLSGKIDIESAESFIKKTIAFAQDETIKGVLLIANSDGGRVGAGECIFREVKELATIKPVVVFIPCNCCSAAYWGIVGAHWIIATATAELGHIGVYRTIEKHTNVHFNNKDGYSGDVEFDIISSGKYKTVTLADTPHMNSEERECIQALMREHHKNICIFIAQERALPFDADADLNDIEWATGKGFSGAHALKLGLIDQIGGFSDSVRELAKLMQENGTPVEKLVPVE